MACDGSPSLLSPDPPPAFDAPILSVVAGAHHSCGLDAEGRAACWGANQRGQLGIDHDSDRVAYPAAVSGGLRFRSLAAGDTHTCGLLSDGGVACWGSNHAGALGDGSRLMRLAPVRVRELENVTSLSAGKDFTCALTEDGYAYCWGANHRGQLGVGTLEDELTPMAVLGDRRFWWITAGGGHACALDGSGAAHCWGAAESGQLGAGRIADQRVPVRVHGGLLFRSLAASALHTCGVAVDRALYCWGAEGGAGPGAALTPVRLTQTLSFASVEASWGPWSCGLLDTAELACWGLGSGGVFDATTPTGYRSPSVQPLGQWISFSGGAAHACGLRLGTAEPACWGDNGSGQLGTYGPD
jgi:alpha-tubulin suppressor-like RCC1 family protein